MTKRCSGRVAAYVLAAAWMSIWIASVQSAGVAYVTYASPDAGLALQSALQSDAETIVLLSNYSIGQEFDEFVDKPLPINRNVTITSQPGQLPVLDLAMKPGIWELCSTCTLRFLRVNIANESSRGTGTMISVVRGQGLGSRLEHLDSYGLRVVCPSTQSSLAIINSTQRSAAYPAPGGRQRAEAVDATYKGRMFSDMVHVTDISSDVPLQLVTGGHYVGGYALYRRNATRLCDHVVPDECLRRETPEACISQLTEAVLGAGPAAAAAAGGSSSRAAAIAAPVAVGGALLLASATALLLWRRRRSKRLSAHLPLRPLHSSKDDDDLTLTSGPFAGTGTGQGTDPQRAAAAMPGLAAAAGGGGGGAAAAAGSGVWELSWCRTAPSMEWAAQEDAGIELGPLLGAGSFARVFKAKWAGLDVAVKVIQHDTSTAEAVANEVQLMMQLNHPNIVRAYHCITKQHKQPLPGSRNRPAHGPLQQQQLSQQSSGSSEGSAWPVIEHSPLLDSVWTGDGSDAAGGHDEAADKGEVGELCETWLVTELCDRGTLARVAADWQPQSNKEDVLRLLLLLQDVARGLKLLHTKHIIHADLNSHNVLVSSGSTAQYGLVAKIADLGLSRVVKQHATHRTTRTVGTLSHQPPELLQDGRSSPAVDIYSFGIMMHELFTGQAAFCHMRYGQIYSQVVLAGARPTLPPDMPDDYQLLMQRCWRAEPAQRPCVDMLLDCLALMIQDRSQAA
ncbi:hypothetical protein OEZ86_008009 [Tetradesmus obliquus]|nr:hypothetical protein OEZ86_008009 [Tetradesmus obliquus]